MPGQRKESKKQVGFYAEPAEADELTALAKSFGMDRSSFLRAIARKEIKIADLPPEYQNRVAEEEPPPDCP